MADAKGAMEEQEGELAEIDQAEQNIKESGKRLSRLQEGLQRTSEHCTEMLRTLDEFEGRMAALEPVLMPLYRNMSLLSRVAGNVEATLAAAKMMGEVSELAKREEAYLALGPTVDNVTAYLASMQRVELAMDMLVCHQLEFCHSTMHKLEGMYSLGLESIVRRYKQLLSQYSSPLDANCMEAIPEHVALELLEMANFAWRTGPYANRPLPSRRSAAEDSIRAVQGELSKYYVMVRGALIGKILGEFLDESAEAQHHRGAYARGSHPFVRAIETLAKLFEEEVAVANRTMCTAAAQEVLRETFKQPSDLLYRSAEALKSRIGVALSRAEFIEQVYVFDLADRLNEVYSTSGCRLLQDIVSSTLRSLTGTSLAFLSSLLELVEKSKTAPPVNAGVYEVTGTVLGCMRRLLDYDRIIEALLTHWSQEHWEGLIGAAPPTSTNFAIALYYQDLLRHLDVNLERACHEYRSPLQAQLFQLNNYSYIERTFKASRICDLLTPEAEQKYAQIVEMLGREFLASWQGIARFLLDTPASAARTSSALLPRDRLKAFLSELEAGLAALEGCVMPDPDLRNFIVLELKSIVLTPFVHFYNQEQATFAHGRVKLDPDQLGERLGSLFQA